MTIEIILLVMAIAGIYEGAKVSKNILLFVDPVGPGRYLFLVACLLFVCTGALLVRQFIKRKASYREAKISLHRGPAGRALLLMLLYGFAIIYLGYIIASTIFFILAQRLFGERSWIRCVVIGISIMGCFYFVFSYLGGVPLP